MRVLNKWDRANEEYAPHRVPAEWKVSLYEDDMDAIVNCASCGKELPYGETYTSMEIHTGRGFGYAVCDECYRKEFRRRRCAE